MKAFVLVVLASLLAPLNIAFADSNDINVGGYDVHVATDSTPTTTTTEGSVDVGNDTYIYGQSQTFQPDPLGDTNPYNSSDTTFSIGVGTSW